MWPFKKKPKTCGHPTYYHPWRMVIFDHKEIGEKGVTVMVDYDLIEILGSA
jgi:hypothetical protein